MVSSSKIVHNFLNFVLLEPDPVSNVSCETVSYSIFLISWTPPIDTIVSQYNVTYYNITCPSEQQSSQSSSVTVTSPSTSTLVSLQSAGQLYNISVRAINALGQSSAVSISYWTPASQGESTIFST